MAVLSPRGPPLLGLLSVLTKPKSQRERLLGAGLSLAHPAAGQGRWEIGPGGHPMGGVSAASASRNSVGSGVPTSLRSPGLRSLLCLLQAACQSRLPDGRGWGGWVLSLPPALRRGVGRSRSLLLTEPLYSHPALSSNSSFCSSLLSDLEQVS